MPGSSNSDQKRLTMESLAEALVLLLGESSFEKITVSRLCAKAGVSRMAFYRNFSSASDVVMYHFMEQQREFLESFRRRSPSYSMAELGRRFLLSVRKDRILFAALFKANLHWLLLDYIYDGLDSFDQEFRGTVYENGKQRSLRLRYEAGGFLCVIAKWVEEDCTVPIDDILRFLLTDSLPPDPGSAEPAG